MVPEDCPLSERQFEVMLLLCGGMTYKQIALRLGRSVSTVRTHLHGSYLLLDVPSGTAAVALFMRKGWHYEPPPPPPEQPPAVELYMRAFERHIHDKDGTDLPAREVLDYLAGKLHPMADAHGRDRDAFLDKIIDRNNLRIRKRSE